MTISITLRKETLHKEERTTRVLTKETETKNHEQIIYKISCGETWLKLTIGDGVHGPIKKEKIIIFANKMCGCIKKFIRKSRKKRMKKKDLTDKRVPSRELPQGIKGIPKK